MRNLIRIAILLLIMSVAFYAHTSSAAAGEKLTIAKCIQLALDRNLTVLQAELNRKSSKSASRATFKDLFPKLSTQYSYTRMRDQRTITIAGKSTPISSRDNYAWDVSVTQPVFHGGALWNAYKSARVDSEISELDEDRVKREIVLEVKKAYYEVLKADQGLREAEAAVERLDSHLREARGFYEVGLIAKNDYLQSEVELAQAKQDVITANNRVDLAKAQLNLLLREDLDTPLELEGKLDFAPLDIGYDSSLARAMELRPEIKADILAVRKAQKELKIARGTYWPQIDFTATYEKRGTDLGMSENPFGDRDSANVVLSATWELWAWGKTRDEVRTAALAIESARASLQETKDKIALQVRDAWLNLEKTRNNIEVAKTSIEQAQENYQLNAARYREQLATSTDVLDAQELLTRARVSYFFAVADYLTAQAELEFATGEKTY